MRIGYQGIEGSNSEVAAKQYAQRKGIPKAEFVPLKNSASVVRELKNKTIELGVVAVRNTIGGIVKETADALASGQCTQIGAEVLPIHHFLYKRKEIPVEQLQTVTSHIQALLQTRNSRASLYPELSEVEAADTALAAKQLAEGTLPSTTAVLCRKEAGNLYNLDLVASNLEDDSNNFTEFSVIL